MGLAFLAHRIPVVSIGRIYRDLPIDAAVADNIEGTHKLVTHLVQLGHRRLAWVGVAYAATFMEERKTGFMKGWCDLELSRGSYFGFELYREPEKRDTDLLLKALNSGVTAFVCGNDNVALKLITALESVGRRVPDDVSVTGFDAAYPSDPSSRRQPTSVDPHFFEIGQIAARMAIERISKPISQPCITSVGCNLVLGDTTAPAPG